MSKEKVLSEETLLLEYLSMPKEERNKRFADTAFAAELIGRSQRTIQFWIEIGAIGAVPIGGRFKVDLESLKEYLKSTLDKRAIK